MHNAMAPKINRIQLEYRVISDHKNRLKGIEDYVNQQSFILKHGLTDSFLEIDIACHDLWYEQICTPLISYRGNLFVSNGACELLKLQKQSQNRPAEKTLTPAQFSKFAMENGENKFHWNELGYSFSAHGVPSDDPSKTVFAITLERIYPDREISADDLTALLDTARDLQYTVRKAGLTNIEIFIDNFDLDDFERGGKLLPDGYHLPVSK
jgi:hypothetical protein